MRNAEAGSVPPIDCRGLSAVLLRPKIDARPKRAICPLIAFGVLALLFAAASAQQPDRSLAVTHVAVIDTRLGSIAPDTTVVIRDGRIVSVSSGDPVLADARIIDGRGRFLTPGFWDMHVHLSYARASALPVLVANGVTGVRDMGSKLTELDRWRTQIADGVLVGPTILRAGPMLNGMEFNEYQLAVGDAVEARTAVRTLHSVGVDFIKLHRRTTRDAFFAIAAEARERELLVSGHVPMTVSAVEASDAGLSSIEHTETLFEGTFASEHADEDQVLAISQWRSNEANQVFATFVQNGTMVDPTLIAQGHLIRVLESSDDDPRNRYIARSARERAEEALAGLRAQPQAFLQARKPMYEELQAVTGLMSRSGVRLLAGSDLSYLHPPGFSLHDELALLVESGVSIEDALRAATTHPAALFQSDDTGTITAGAWADLVLLEANPLENIANTRRISAVILRGQYLDRQRLDQILQEGEQLAEIN